MGIEQVHAYRFSYLKSDKWKDVRLKAIVRDKGICRLCGAYVGINGDAHHLFYPASFWNTKSRHLVTVCRSCHDVIHQNIPKSIKKRQVAEKLFRKLKTKLTLQKLRESKQAKKSSHSQCWFCHRESPVLKSFKSNHLKLVNFYPPVCPECSIFISEKTNGSEHPFKIIKLLRAKKNIDSNS